MKRTSNLAFNREFPAKTGMAGIKKDCQITIRRDFENRFDDLAVGIFLPGIVEPLGWLFKKDSNRPDVLKKLGIAEEGIQGTVIPAPAGAKVKFLIGFWL